MTSERSAELGVVPVALIERCLRLRNTDGTHRVTANARDVIRAAMDAHLSGFCTDPACTARPGEQCDHNTAGPS